MNKFAFIAHPIEIQDCYSKYPILQKMPGTLSNKIVEALPPFILTEINGIKTSTGEVTGYLIVVPFSLNQLIEAPDEKILRKIKKAGYLAKKLGVELIGLGSYLSEISNLDRELTECLSIPVTTGKTLMMITIIEAVKKAVLEVGRDFQESDVVIFTGDDNFTGLISRYIAREVKYLTLVSPERKIMEELSRIILEETGTAVHITDSIQGSLERGDVIFIKDVEDHDLNHIELKKNAIICDLSKYRIVSRKLKEVREDLLCIDDGIIKLPWTLETEKKLPTEFKLDRCSSPLAETILLTVDKYFEIFNMDDDLTMDKIDQMLVWLKEFDFQLAGISHLKEEIIII